MSDSMDKLAKGIRNAIDEKNDRKPKAYDTQAEVLSKDGDILWVHIPGGVDRTPVRRTVDANEGDSVMVRVADGRAWTLGNATNPPTDDSYARRGLRDLKKATQGAVDFVGDLSDQDVTVNSIRAATGYIDDLYSKNIHTDNIWAATGYIDDLTSKHITVEDIEADHATVGTLEATYAKISDLTAANAKIDNLEANEVIINDTLKATNAEVEYLSSDWISTDRLVLTGNNKNNYPPVQITEEEFNVNKTAYWTKNGDTYTQCTASSVYDPDEQYYVRQTVQSIIEAINTANNTDPQVIVSNDKLIAASMDVAELSAITANMGTLTAGKIQKGNNFINLNTVPASMEFKNASTWDTATQGLKWDTQGNLNIKGTIQVSSGSNVPTTTEMNAAIDGINVGARNLFRGSSLLGLTTLPNNSEDTTFTKDWVRGYNSPTCAFSNFEYGIRQAEITLSSPSNLGLSFVRLATDIDLDPNSYYTISCWAKCTKANAQLAIGLSYYNTSNKWVWRGGTNRQSFTATNTWQKFTLTFKPDADTKGVNYCMTCDAGVSGGTDKLYIRQCKMEKGNKATDWTLAPEDVQAEIDAKRSVHTIDGIGADASYTYAQILGYSTRTDALNWHLSTVNNVKVGDTVRVGINASNMGSGGTKVYLLTEVTEVNSSTSYIRGVSKGLDTTVIDGGHILTGTIDANNVNISNLTVGAFGTTEQNKVLNDKIQVGGKNLAMTTGAMMYPTSYNCAQIPICERLEAGVTYTFQMWGVTVNNTNTGTNWIRAYWGGGMNGLGDSKMPDSKGYFCTTFTATQGMLDMDPDGWHWYLNIYNSNEATARNFSVKKWKLERGNKPTDWSPCPADTQSGENLIRGTRDMMNGTGAADTGTFRSSGGTLSHTNFSSSNLPPVPELKGYITITNSGSSATNIGIAQDSIANKAVVGKHYVQSCWVTCNGAANNCLFYLQPWWTSASSLSGNSSPNIKLNSAVWQYVEFSGTLTGTQQSSYSGGYAYGVSIPAGGMVHIAGIKVEEGIVGTGWTPAKEEADASTYITQIDNAGITIHPSSTTNDRIALNASGLAVYKGGNLKASFADSVHLYGGNGTSPHLYLNSSVGQIVKDSTHYMQMDANGMQVFSGDASNSVAFFGSSTRIGKSTKDYLEVTDSGVNFYDGANSRKYGAIYKGSYAYSMIIGAAKDAYTYGTLSCRGNDGICVLTAQKGTSSSNKWTTQTLTDTAWNVAVGTYASSATNYPASFQLTASKLALYYNGQTDSNIKFSVVPSTGSIYIANSAWLYGKKADGNADLTMVGINSSNQMFFGYGSYSSSVGASYFDGNTVNIRSKGAVNITGVVYPSSNIRLKNNVSLQGATTGDAWKSLIYISTSNTVNLGSSDCATYVNGTSFRGSQAYSTSDLRLKHNISLLDKRSSELIMKLKPFEFEWTEEQKNFQHRGKYFGFGAQEVKQALSEVGYNPDSYNMVKKDPEGYYALGYEELIPHLIYVAQEQHKEIELLKAEIKAIKEAC